MLETCVNQCKPVYTIVHILHRRALFPLERAATPRDSPEGQPRSPPCALVGGDAACPPRWHDGAPRASPRGEAEPSGESRGRAALSSGERLSGGERERRVTVV